MQDTAGVRAQNEVYLLLQITERSSARSVNKTARESMPALRKGPAFFIVSLLPKVSLEGCCGWPANGQRVAYSLASSVRNRIEGLPLPESVRRQHSIPRPRKVPAIVRKNAI